MEASSWIKVANAENRVAVDTLNPYLDKGEAEAIILALEKDALLIIDDGNGRRNAKAMGLKITGKSAYYY